MGLAVTLGNILDPPVYRALDYTDYTLYHGVWNHYTALESLCCGVGCGRLWRLRFLWVLLRR